MVARHSSGGIGLSRSDFGTRLAGVPEPITPSPAELEGFRQAVMEHYRRHGRDLPWRRTRDPYALLVSEMMLQQTQAARVAAKYEQFLTAFPTLNDLASAPLARVLAAWQGLGYNRRALALHRTARLIVVEQGGFLPRSPTELRELPGIGPATAAAICVFAYDTPLVFIETNIRSAFIHHFFQESTSVSDAAILPLIELTLDEDDPRRWYYALMDYGAWIKRNHPNPSRRSRHHTAQTPFVGSRRQLRAAILRILLSAPAPVASLAIEARLPTIRTTTTEIHEVLEELTEEGFLVRTERGYRVA